MTFMMGSIYIVYSIFYMTFAVEPMKLFVQFLLNSLYLMLSITVITNAADTLKLLRAQQVCIKENRIDQLR